MQSFLTKSAQASVSLVSHISRLFRVCYQDLQSRDSWVFYSLALKQSLIPVTCYSDVLLHKVQTSQRQPLLKSACAETEGEVHREAGPQKDRQVRTRTCNLFVCSRRNISLYLCTLFDCRLSGYEHACVIHTYIHTHIHTYIQAWPF